MMTRTELLERAPYAVLPERGETVLCAVSGGLDSMCLLFMLDAWCREREGQVIAAHFNHQLRDGTALRDEAFVRKACGDWGTPLTVGRGDVRALAAREGLSLEEAARTLRYAFLRQTAAERGCKRLYTAHHAGDNAETVLLNLIRGTGLRGLAGMEYRRDDVCRPLLGVTREELETCAAAYGIPHVEDETNADPAAASRNFLRLNVMPLLKELNPKAVEHINQTARYVREADRALERDAAERTARVEVREGRVTLNIDLLFAAPEAVRPRMLLILFDRLGVGRRDIGAVHLNAILSMARHTDQSRESRLSLPHGVTARYCRRWLILETRPQTLTEVQLMPGRPLIWGDYRLTLLDRPEGEGLALRPRTPSESWAVSVGPCVPGDRLTLPGARGSRSIKRLCLDRRISLAERDRLPAVYVEGRLAAVWRLGVDEAFLPRSGPEERTEEAPEAAIRFIKIERDNKEDGHDAQ
ncbi:tRNA lysidine(34) synthetase TilS [uncultured Oscillibacter sp.]|uniref:tRNA lysidine(34) synthetase TilS n=1 Tax=uncultured Oscillibacter sp. TaxID=876091 RepID=UPI0026278C3F|nr:tRNA lysidine(34) synthetase TilS [uncultured Oscillibacter sp.]